MKRIYVAVMALLFSISGVFAQDPEVKLVDVTAGAGEILVPFEMLNFTDNVNSFTFKINLDDDLLEFVEVTNIVGFNGGFWTANQLDDVLTIGWFDIGAGYQPNGQVFDIKFNFTGTASTDLVFDQPGCEVTYGVFPVADITYTDGEVNIVQDPVVDIGDVVVPPGEVLVPVEMLFFTEDINSFTYYINYDVDLLQFVMLDNLVAGLQANPPLVAQAGGTLTITWQDATGFTPNGQVFDMKFNYTGGFDTDITWDPGNEVTYGVIPVANVSYVQGSVEQVDAVGTVSLTDQTAATGTLVNVPLHFEGAGFGNVGAFDLIMNYDQTELSYIGLDSPAVAGILANQAGGELTLTWQGAAQDFTNIDVVNIQFQYNGVSTSVIEFVPGCEVSDDTPTLLATDYVDGNIDPVISTSTLDIADMTAFPGQTVTVPLQATDIGVVASITLNIEFDNTNLAFADTSTQQLTGWQFNQAGNQITFTWIDNTGVGVDIADGDLLSLQFVYNGGGAAPITFEAGTQMTDVLAQIAPVTYLDGGITPAVGDAKAKIDSIINCDQNQAIVPVTLSDVDPITAMNFIIGFDQNVLNFLELQNVNPLLTNISTNAAGGTLTVTWATDNGAVDANGLLFDLAFNYMGQDCDITFEAGTELIGATAQTLPVTYINGNVDCNLDERTLTLDQVGNGTLVVSEDETVLLPDDGTTNEYTVLFGTELSLEATPDLGWEFTTWIGNVDDVLANPTTITMDDNYTVTGQFDQIDYDLILVADPVEGGTVDGGGIYHYLDVVTVTATPNEGWEVTAWTDEAGDTLSTAASFDYTMPPNDVTLTAHFEMIDYTLTTVADPVEGGTTDGDGIYNFEDIVPVTATPNEGWEVIAWTDQDGDTVSTIASFDYTMPSNDVTLTCHFEMIDYTLTTVADPVEGGTTDGDGIYNFGDIVPVTATATQGWDFVAWIDDAGDTVSTVAAFDYTMPSSDMTLTAHFIQVEFTLTLVADPVEGGTVDGEGIYLFGDIVPVTATANEGWEFTAWTDESGDTVSIVAAFDYTMPDQDMTLTAHFEMIDYTLTLVADPVEGGTVDGGGIYNFGDEVTVTATVNANYEFVNWTVENGDEASADPVYTFTMPSSDLTLTANFNLMFELTLIATPAEGGTVTGAGFYPDGTVVDIDATEEAGYVFHAWFGDVADSTAAATTITIDDDKTAEAFFYLLGDANGDGSVNVLDVTTIANYIMGENPDPFIFVAADVNFDEVIDLLDLVAVVNIILGISDGPIMNSAPGSMYLAPDKITLDSDGTLAGVQFELTGSNLEDVVLEMALEGYIMNYNIVNNNIRVVVFSMTNMTIPSGMVDFINIQGQAGDLEFVDAFGSNTTPEMVEISTSTFVGVPEINISALDVSVYPNPAKQDVNVSFTLPEDSEVMIQMIDMTGSIVATYDATVYRKGNNKFEISSIANPGNYVLRLIAEPLNSAGQIYRDDIKVIILK